MLTIPAGEPPAGSGVGELATSVRFPPLTAKTRQDVVAAAVDVHPVAVARRLLVRYGLVIVVAWIGALRYAGYEATAIQPLIAHSPLMSWLYDIFSTRALGAVLGSAEIGAALLVGLYPRWPRLSAAGSAFTVLSFLSTPSFLLTTPGVLVPPAAGGGFRSRLDAGASC